MPLPVRRSEWALIVFTGKKCNTLAINQRGALSSTHEKSTLIQNLNYSEIH